MKIKASIYKNLTTPIERMLYDHFGYSIADIKSYDELTDEEKKIVPKELFDKIVEDGEDK